MSWYHIPGNMQDVVICSCVRLNRNLAGYPFPSRLDAARAKELLARVGAVLDENGFIRTDPAELSATAARALVEKGFMTPRFLRESLPRALYLNDPCNLSVMLCEEDHTVMQGILSGLALWDAFAGASKVENILDSTFELAFDSRLGYLTADPALLGPAMEATVTLSLPLLGDRGRIHPMVRRQEQRGMRLSPVTDDGEKPWGNLWRLSCLHTLGYGEEELLEGLDASAHKLVEEERGLRESITGEEADRLRDRIGRAEGILRHATMLGVAETAELLSLLRTGAAMGLTEGVRVELMTTLLTEILPATLMSIAEPPLRSLWEQDILRARVVKEKLFGSGEGQEMAK